MVRVNLINPRNLADQHLIAEYNEILMLMGYVKKYPALQDTPSNYALGKGHIKFFKNKLHYLKERHELIKKEMRKRGFKTNKILSLKGFHKSLLNKWAPNNKDIKIIKERLKGKISKKPEFYKHYGKNKEEKFFLNLIEKA